MAYAGLPPASFTNNLTNVQLIDDISGSFNGSTQTFALTSNSAPFHAVSARSLLVTLGGITQKPQVDYTVDGSNITFTTAPVSGLTFAARNIYGLNYLNNVNDGVITPAKLSTGAPTWNTGGTLTVSGDLNVTGSFNSGTQGLFWGDNEPANFGDGNDLKIFHNSAASFIQDTGTGPLYIEGNEITIKEYGTATTFATFNSTGVGIGTTNPVANFKLDVNGDLSLGEYGGSDNTYIDQKQNGNLEIINSGVNANSGAIRINKFNNTAGGTTYYRDFIVYDGKNNVIQFVDGSSGSVGIGTDNPVGILDVRSSASDSGIHMGRPGQTSNFVVFNNGGQNSSRLVMRHDGTNNIEFRADGAGSYIKTGNVGIGNDSPGGRLHVDSVGSGIVIDGSNFSELAPPLSTNDAYIFRSTNDGTLNFSSRPVAGGRAYRFWRGSNVSMIIDDSGNVGIGTINPGGKLEVYSGTNTQSANTGGDNIIVKDNNGAGISIFSGDGNSQNIYLGSSSLNNNVRFEGFYNGGSPYFKLYVAGSEAYQVDNNLNVLPGADATQNLGASNKRWANIYSADLQLSNEGSKNDVDGTWGQYTIQEGETDLFLINRRNGKKYKFVLQEVN